jgi:hypothetical protein
MACAFCGGQMPCWCLIVRRDREDEALLAQAVAEEAQAAERRIARRRMVLLETRISSAESRVAALTQPEKK